MEINMQIKRNMLLKTVLTTLSALYKKNITHLWMLICWKMKKKNHLYCVTLFFAAEYAAHTHTVFLCFQLFIYSFAFSGCCCWLFRTFAATNAHPQLFAFSSLILSDPGVPPK